jgi:anaerobic magnesium-protoporphyrin IX monomethyl ester cyclase
MHKPLKLSDAREKVRLVQKYNIRHNAFFMIGLPDETMEQIQETIRFVKDLKLEAANLFAFFPLPGTAAYETCKARGYIPADFDFTQNSSTRGRITTEHFTAEQITALVRKNWTLQYLRPIFHHPFVFLERYGYLLANPKTVFELARRVVGRAFARG